MARSSTASYDIAEEVRNTTQQSVERVRELTNSGLFGVRDLAQHSFEQSREAFLGFLSTTQKSLASFDQQALDMRQTTLSIATKVVASSFELAENLLRARSAEEMLQLQAEFAESQMQLMAEQTRELGRTFVEQTRELGQAAARTANEAVRSASSLQPKELGSSEGK